MYSSVKKIVHAAAKGHFAVPAFDCPNLEFVQAAIRAGTAKKSPVIVMVTEHDVDYIGFRQIVNLVKASATEAPQTPVALHLDHTARIDVVKEAIAHGFTSVMIDTSRLPYEKNLTVTKKIVQYAHRRGVVVQAELGQMLESQAKVLVAKKKKFSPEQFANLLTNPRQAHEFVVKTQVDTLAVAIGSVHGAIKYLLPTPQLDFARLIAIYQNVAVPLVLHGGSDVPAAMLKNAVRHGIRIVNFRTDYFSAFTIALRESLRKNAAEIDPRQYLAPATAAAQKVMEQKMQALGSAGKASLVK